MKLYLGITGTPAASAEDVMQEARSFAGARKGRVARRAKWWWITLLVGVGILLLATTAVKGPVLVVVWTLAGALLVLIGIVEGYLHLRVLGKEAGSSQ